MDSELVRLGWVDLKSSRGWVPWRLVINFPKPLENKISISSKISDDFAKLDRNNTPFNALELSKDFLKGLRRVYDFSHDCQAQKFLEWFMTDLWNIFWRRFGKDEAMRRFIQLTESAEKYRSQAVDVDTLLVLSGIIAWDQEFRNRFFGMQKDCEHDIDLYQKIAKSKHKQPALGKGRIDLYHNFLRAQSLLKKIKHYQKEDYSPVFKQITVKLMYNSDIFPIKPICEFYKAFGIPSSEKTNYDEIVMAHYNNYHRVDFSKKIEDFYYDILSSAGHLNVDEIREINTIRNTPPGGVIKQKSLSEQLMSWHKIIMDDKIEREGKVEPKSQKHFDKSGIKSFPLPEGAQLSEIYLSFISNDTIKVKIRDKSIKFHYVEIGFRDNRKGDLWDSRWEVLRDDFAQNNGIVSHDTQNTKCDVKMAVYSINKRLAKIFNRDERYIYYDAKTGTYKTKFNIFYNVGGKTDSNEQNQSKDEHSDDVERLLKLPKDEKIKEMQRMYDLSEDQVNELKKKSEPVLNANLKASLDT